MLLVLLRFLHDQFKVELCAFCDHHVSTGTVCSTLTVFASSAAPQWTLALWRQGTVCCCLETCRGDVSYAVVSWITPTK